VPSCSTRAGTLVLTTDYYHHAEDIVVVKNCHSSVSGEELTTIYDTFPLVAVNTVNRKRAARPAILLVMHPLNSPWQWLLRLILCSAGAI